MIRTGILCVPHFDAEAAEAVRGLLRQHVVGVMVLHENSSASQRFLIEELLRRWCDEEELDLVITIGGTLPAPGPGAQEIVPEATLAVVERLMPGLAEEMRAYAREESVLALLERGVAGIRGRSLILNLPAGAAAARLFCTAIVDLIKPVLSHLQEQPDAPRFVAPSFTDTASADNTGEAPRIATASPQTTDPRNAFDAAEFAAFLHKRK